MTGCEQFEVWVQNDRNWEMIASFLDLEVASSVTRSRSSRVRVVHAVYEEGKLVSQDVLVELGITRENSG